MGRVIEFPSKENNQYTTGDGVIGVINIPAGIEMVSYGCVNTIIFGEVSVEFSSREDLAKWLWMCTRLVDSEGRYQEESYVGLDYV